MKLSKAELRQRLKASRLAMPAAEHLRGSAAIVDRLRTAADWSSVLAVHYFEPLAELAEPNIGAFITYLEDTYPQLYLTAPRLIESRWELIGTQSGPPPRTFDIVIVPMLGFDPQTRHRLGYGGGYYDRFLAEQPQARKIGICFEAGRVAGLPAEPHDIALDELVTEVKIYPSAGWPG